MNLFRRSMPVLIALVACASLLLPKASPAAAEKYVVVGEQQSGKVAKIGMSQLLVIQLPSQQGSTGYGWTVAQFDKSLCKLEELSDDQVKQLQDSGVLPKPNDSGLIGAVHPQIFQLTPLSKGTTKIQLQYVRSWEPKTVAKQFSLTVRIGK
ncbi:MAG: protease inhibitor I42 family protein [Candidatus Acidiferrales bacterium]